MLRGEHHPGNSLWCCSKSWEIICSQCKWPARHGQDPVDNLITVNRSKHPICEIQADSTILHGHPRSFLGCSFKNDPDSSCRKFGDPFPFEWVFPESKINKMSEFVHLVGKASSPSSVEEAELRNVVVSAIQSWRHNTTHTLFESNSHHTFS